MIRHWLSLSTLIGLTLLFVLLWDSPPAILKRGQPAEATPAMLVASVATNAVQQRYNETGQVAYQFTATEVRHFQRRPGRPHAKDYSEFTAPNLILYNDPAHPWYVKANTGKANQAGTVITLTGNVVIWEFDTKGQRSELTTSFLRLKPDEQYAETNKPVIMTAADGKTTAIGMKAFLKEERFELLSRVRGIHDPKQK